MADQHAPGIRWIRIVTAAAAVVVLSFLGMTLIATGYAFMLAFRAHGAPDQSAIAHFASRSSRALMPWLEGALTLAAAVVVARKVSNAHALHGLFTGILAGLFSLMVPLAFGGHLQLYHLVFLLVVSGLGWVGGMLGRRLATSA